MSDGSTNWGSAIMLILNGTKEEHLNMLEGGIIAKLLDEKWSTYAQVREFVPYFQINDFSVFSFDISIFLKANVFINKVKKIFRGSF